MLKENFSPTKLSRKFERKYSWISKEKKKLLEPKRIELFLQVVDGELQEKFKKKIEDKKEDEGFTII